MGAGDIRIFISYRRSETRGYAGWLSDSLESEFGRANVFRDVEKIGAGDWRKAIDKSVRLSDAVLCVIGDQWLSVTDRKTGERRLDDPDDILRWEVALALTCKAPHGRVIPILLDEARMPEPEELPEELRELPNQNARRLTYETWRAGLQGLVDLLGEIRPRRPKTLKGEDLARRWRSGFDVPNCVGVAGGFPPKGTGSRLSALVESGEWATADFQVLFAGECPSHQNWGEIDDFIATVERS